jgi:peptidoglycan/LPS O-acetylase OafA/YrhL
VEASPETHARLDYIDGFRAIAIFAVLIFHAGIWAGVTNDAAHRILGVGRAGVDLFLVLSGFVLYWPVVKRPEIRSIDVKQFAKRRITRIVPPFYAAILLFLGVKWLAASAGSGPVWWQPAGYHAQVYGAVTGGDLLAHVTLTHGFFQSTIHSMDAAFWSLSLEMQFYFFLPLLVLLQIRLGPAVIALPFALNLLYRLIAKWSAPEFLLTNVGNELFISRWAEFACGMAAAYFLARGGPSRPTSRLGAVVFLTLSCAAEITHPSFFLLPVFWGLGAGFLVSVVTQDRKLQRVLEARPMLWLGRISYSIYLVHGSVFFLLSIGLAKARAEEPMRIAIYSYLGYQWRCWLRWPSTSVSNDPF